MTSILMLLGFSKSKDVLEDIRSNKFQLMYALVEQALTSKFLEVHCEADVENHFC